DVNRELAVVKSKVWPLDLRSAPRRSTACWTAPFSRPPGRPGCSTTFSCRVSGFSRSSQKLWHRLLGEPSFEAARSLAEVGQVPRPGGLCPEFPQARRARTLAPGLAGMGPVQGCPGSRAGRDSGCAWVACGAAFCRDPQRRGREVFET